MDRKTLVTAAIIITILIAAIAVYLVTSATEYNYKTCKQINKEQKNYILALKTKDTSYCTKTGNPEFCTAQVTEHTAYCNMQEDKNYCLAIIKGDETLCPENDWWCKADASKNEEYCSKLPAQEQAECTASTQLNEEYFNQRMCE